MSADESSSDVFHRLNTSLSDANFKHSCSVILSKIPRPDPRLLRSVLVHDNSQQATIAVGTDEYNWYLAIGSMTNPISLHLRDLKPLVSYPAICSDYRLVFRGQIGMADIEPCQGAEFHGVVHLLSAKQMAYLDQIEYMYQRILVTIVDYRQQSHLVYVYKMGPIEEQNQPISIPTERYLDIIVKGCEHYHVCPSYIDRLKHHQPVVPRKLSTTYDAITDVPDVYYNHDDLAQHDGSDPMFPLWICINGKILEYTCSPTDEQQQRFYQIFKSHFGGREIVHVMFKAWYEPMYKLPAKHDELCDGYRAFVEDICIAWVLKNNTSQIEISHWKPIGRLLSP